MKRILCLLICIIMLLGAASNAALAYEPGDPVTLRVELWDRSDTPAGTELTDNYLTRYIAEHFTAETNITIEFVPIPRSGDDDKIQVLMASNTAPDIILSYDPVRFYNYASNGGLTEFTDEMLAEYAPNLLTSLESVFPYGKFDGKQYAINAKRALTSQQNAFIRKDLLDAMGLPLPTTTQELYDTLKQVMEADPGGIGTENIVAYGMGPNSAGDYDANYSQFIHSFIDFDGMTEEEFCTLPIEFMPGAKEGFRLLNQMYNEGMISPDFAFDVSGTQLNQDIVTGRTVFFVMKVNDPYGAGVNGLAKNLDENIPGAVIYPVDTFLNANGEYVKTMDPPNGMYIMVPKVSEDMAPAALQYLDWMSRNFIALKFGEEGVHHRLVDGIPEMIQENVEQNRQDLWKNSDICILFHGNDYGSLELNILASANAKKPHVELSILGHEIALNGAYQPYVFDRVIESEVKYGAALRAIIVETAIKSIMAAPGEFDATYDAMFQKWLEEGGQKVMEEKAAALK